MTDENDMPEDVSNALEAEGHVDPEGQVETEAEDAGGPLGGVAGMLDMAGSGKDLSSYETDPIASAFADGDETPPKGALHIARGVDGLSPLAATHPLIDIAVGFVLLRAEGRLENVTPASSSKVDKDDELDDMGEMKGDSGSDLT